MLKRIIALTLALTCCFVTLTGCKKVENDKIDMSGMSKAPVSAAVIGKMGFTAAIPDDESAPVDITGKPEVGTTIYGYCQVKDMDDIATNLTVYWKLPDNGTTQKETIAVTKNGYYYSEQKIENLGNYEAVWTLYGQDESSEKTKATEEK